jgi:hypothetical protein
MSKILYPAPLTNEGNLVTLKFRLQYTSAGAADFVVPAGAIASNTRTSTGLYTLTLNEMYPVFLGGLANVMTQDTASAGGDAIVHFFPTDYAPTTGVLTYRVVSGDGSSAVEDVADNDWIYFELNFARRSTGCPSGAI